MGALSISVSAILIVVGMFVYIHVKYTEDRQQEWFIKAVKDTMERIEVSEYRPSARAYGRRRRASRRAARETEKREYKEPEAVPEKSPMPRPATTPVQSSPSAAPGAGAQAAWTPSPTTPNIIKCPKCSMPLKIPDIAKRPLSIRCPHCSSIGVIN
ncbi:MAG: hypothetical protein JSV49_06040 [Thermoplasmata archaeon]|nr:MAG: hypothetical protein JSV49_06040 [Thermoplasmata archaeon]